MESRLQVFCKSLMEAAWLAAAAVIPLFFSISTARIFEPDKALVLKSLALAGGAAWLLNAIQVLRQKKRVAVRAFLRNPLVIPVLVLAGIYVLSSLFSIAQWESWLGSYSRSQGTVVFLCYVTLFLIVVAELRSRAQLRRLQFVLVMTSIPLAVYAVLQHFGVDQIPWPDRDAGRTSATMGNPIFLGGYLVMLIPITASMLMDRSRAAGKDGRWGSGAPGAVWCGIALLAQAAALLSTQSRGPVIGLCVALYICVFVCLLLFRTSGENRLGGPVLAAGLGLLIPVSAALVFRYVSAMAGWAAIAFVAIAVAAAAVIYFLAWRTRWGHCWLWLTWLFQAFALVLVFWIAAPAIGQTKSGQPSRLGRMAEFSDHSVSARKYLWETGIQFVKAGYPDTFPDGTKDSYQLLRPLVGYGPECAWLAANLHAVQRLVWIHTREAADRLHNDQLDNLITIGFAGAIACLFIVGAAVYFSFRCLGLALDRRDRNAFILLSLSGSLAGILGPILAGAPYLAFIGVELGLLTGIVLYLARSGWKGMREGTDIGVRQWLGLGILGALIAHFVETGVGIAVTPTRLLFFLLIAILSAVSARELAEQEEAATNRKSGSQASASLPVYVSLASLVVMVESWCFTFNTANESSAPGLFLKIWFSGLSGREGGFHGSAALFVLLAIVAGSLAFMYPESRGPHSFAKRIYLPAAVMAAVWVIMGLLTAVFWTALDNPSPAGMAAYAEARISLFMIALVVVLAASARFIYTRNADKREFLPTRTSDLIAAAMLSLCVAAGIWHLSLRPAWADTACRVAAFYEKTGNAAAAVQVYERAVGFAPKVIPYRLSLGLAGVAAGADQNWLERASRSMETAKDLSPINPVAYRKIGAFHSQIGERSSDPQVRTARIQQAIPFLQTACRLAPHSPDPYTETGRCFFLLGDYGKAESLYGKALELNPRYSRTHMYFGEMHYRRNDLEQALRSFAAAAEYDGTNVEALKNVGFILARLGRTEEAIRANLRAVQFDPPDAMVLTRLSLLYFKAGNYNLGMSYARDAYGAIPPAKRPGLDQFIESLKSQAAN